MSSKVRRKHTMIFEKDYKDQNLKTKRNKTTEKKKEIIIFPGLSASGAQGLTDSKLQALQIGTPSPSLPTQPPTHASSHRTFTGPLMIGHKAIPFTVRGLSMNSVIFHPFYHWSNKYVTSHHSPLQVAASDCQEKQVLTPNCLHCLDPAH